MSRITDLQTEIEEWKSVVSTAIQAGAEFMKERDEARQQLLRNAEALRKGSDHILELSAEVADLRSEANGLRADYAHASNAATLAKAQANDLRRKLREAEAERDALSHQVKSMHVQIGEERGKLEQAEAECLEQARLNGMGSEREARLLTRVKQAEDALESYQALVDRITEYGTERLNERDAVRALLANVAATCRGLKPPSEEVLAVIGDVLEQADDLRRRLEEAEELIQKLTFAAETHLKRAEQAEAREAKLRRALRPFVAQPVGGLCCHGLIDPTDCSRCGPILRARAALATEPAPKRKLKLDLPDDWNRPDGCEPLAAEPKEPKWNCTEGHHGLGQPEAGETCECGAALEATEEEND
jgi:chromosome segregation ATPase